MSGLLTSVELGQPVGQAYLSGEAAVSIPFKEFGTEMISLSPSFAVKIDKDNKIVGFFSWEREHTVSFDEEEVCNSFFSGLGLQHNLTEDFGISSWLQGGYYSGSGQWWDEEESGTYDYRGINFGLQEELSYKRLRIRFSSTANYSLDDQEINSVDARLRIKDTIKARNVPVLGGLFKLAEISRLSLEVEYRHKFKMEKADQDILRAKGEILWEPADEVAIGLGVEDYLDITSETNNVTPFVSLKLQPTEDFAIQLMFFYGRSVYTSSY